jgi:hypothetical protein
MKKRFYVIALIVIVVSFRAGLRADDNTPPCDTEPTATVPVPTDLAAPQPTEEPTAMPTDGPTPGPTDCDDYCCQNQDADTCRCPTGDACCLDPNASDCVDCSVHRYDPACGDPCDPANPNFVQGDPSCPDPPGNCFDWPNPYGYRRIQPKYPAHENGCG